MRVGRRPQRRFERNVRRGAAAGEEALRFGVLGDDAKMLHAIRQLEECGNEGIYIAMLGWAGVLVPFLDFEALGRTRPRRLALTDPDYPADDLVPRFLVAVRDGLSDSDPIGGYSWIIRRSLHEPQNRQVLLRGALNILGLAKRAARRSAGVIDA